MRNPGPRERLAAPGHEGPRRYSRIPGLQHPAFSVSPRVPSRVLCVSVTRNTSLPALPRAEWSSIEREATACERLLLLLLSRFSRVRLCVTLQTAAHQAPPFLGFSRQEHWSGLPFPSPMHESEKGK